MIVDEMSYRPIEVHKFTGMYSSTWNPKSRSFICMYCSKL